MTAPGLPLTRLLAGGVIGLCAVPLVAQQQPTFRVTNQTVSIYATVTDPEGRLVPDLMRDDFEVFDNDRPQDLAVFENGIQPITAAVMRDMSGSMLPARDLTDAAVRKFVASLIDGDRACYGVFGGSVLVSRKLTGDHNQLLQAISMPLPALRDGTALWDAVSVGMQLLYHEPGRRVVLAMTDGGDNRSEIDLQKLEDVIIRDEFMLYMVGLTTRTGMQDPPRDLKRAASVASGTGGGYFYVRPGDDLDAAFHRISEELHHQYLLGFTPAALDGKVHKLDVRMKRGDLKARARKSYVASDK
ncbi:MAG TPA: VWA domain-containing protein [Vicinamibacterales bacterium]|nr:VWA domain-containing protein [Vicinamibacterales bacterium]